MEQFLTGDVGVAVAAALAVIATNLATWGFKKLGEFVHSTPTTLDDKLYDIVKAAVHAATAEKEKAQ